MKRISLGVALFAPAIFWAQGLTFEVASVKPAPPPTGGGIRVGMNGGPGTSDPGRITCENMALRDLVVWAYSLKDYQLSAPDWLASERYNVIATLPATTTKDQILQMWRSLLAERFKLKVHHQSKELAVYALIVGKGSHKLVDAAADTSTPQGNSRTQELGEGLMRTSGSRMGIETLILMLTHYLDRPVVDDTGLTGRYRISFDWQRDDRLAGPSIFAAVQEQLGLKLDPRKSPVDVLVVDSVEKVPTAN